jgi:hypothetical protein
MIVSMKGTGLDFAPFKAALRHSNPSSITEGREENGHGGAHLEQNKKEGGRPRLW